MRKYDPIRKYLSGQQSAEIVLKFSQVERIIGGRLPGTALRAAWWARAINPTRAAWIDAGYDATLLAGRKVRFTRLL